ncbi:vWA domain-containing protein [Deinococcus multiflagellatus]|uniref:vWA domain-containing protein n=1 Tax=Deinococcus multiflagellatus TaxID=1656887 RepID=UPI001CCC3810|nr:vWA domain-containing protein [Deinococcus multiflagellatus]MBZ9714745.1 VWA domain-containing protein [Deinococcus multiflagellatus]
MRRTALLCALLLTSAAAQEATCALPEGGALPTRTRAVFVLDTSGSMRGIGDGQADIFERVKASIGAYVRGQRPDRVELLTFDSGLRSRRSFTQPAGTAAWNTALANLKADGKNTYLYRSLQGALAPLSAAGGDVTQVFVLTDGIDNDTREAGRTVTPEAALAAFRDRGPLDRLTYVALGTDIPPEAQAALQRSTYASGLTVPVGQVPDLTGAGLEGGLRVVTDPARLPPVFAPGTPLTLGVGPELGGAKLQASGGQWALALPGRVPPGSPALLCAPPPSSAGWIAPRPRQVLLRLTLPGAGLTWLNPGADRALRAGEDVVLRLRAAPGLNPAAAVLGGLGPGVRGAVEARRGAREFAVRLTGLRPQPGVTLTPTLTFPGLPALALPPVQGAAGGRVPDPVTPPPTRAAPREEGRPVWPVLLTALLGGGLLAAGVLIRGRRAPAAPPAPRPAPPPAVEGLTYREDRTLSLVSAQGDVTGVPTPLGGPFDLGQLSSVPHLSGLRAEQHRDGLRILRIPPDLEVSQGARLVKVGDVIRPGTLLGVAVARRARAPHPPLGELAGLGLPLALHVGGHQVRLRGPYGEHALGLSAPVTDLGRVLRAPALEELAVSLSGRDVLLLRVPDHLQVRAAGEASALRPGAALPAHAVIDFLKG